MNDQHTDGVAIDSIHALMHEHFSDEAIGFAQTMREMCEENLGVATALTVARLGGNMALVVGEIESPEPLIAPDTDGLVSGRFSPMVIVMSESIAPMLEFLEAPEESPNEESDTESERT